MSDKEKRADVEAQKKGEERRKSDVSSSSGGKKSDEEDDEVMEDDTDYGKAHHPVIVILLVLVVIASLYFFICSLDILGSAFKLIGGMAAGEVFGQDSIITNPVAGLMIGVLATVLLQSSSTSTSLVVTMVAANILTVQEAVPIIMGANIGTSVTNTIVALGQINDKKMFERAFSGATVHDVFNILTVCILLPIEAISHFLQWMTGKLVDAMDLKANEDTEIELLSRITDPLTDEIVQIDKDPIKKAAKGEEVGDDETILKKYCSTKEVTLANGTVVTEDVKCSALFSQFDLSDSAAGTILLIVSLICMFVFLFLIIRCLRSIFQGQISKVIKKTVNADFPGYFSWLTGYLAILLGAGLTILVQSSSIFTSTLTPLVGLNIVTVERAFPLTLGSNIGTTVTSLLAALASDSKFREALQISLCHLSFNIIGILIWYPIPKVRKIPLGCAKFLGKTTAKYRWFALIYLLLVFLIFPAIIFGLSLAGIVFVIVFCVLVLLFVLTIVTINLLQNYYPKVLPGFLKNWDFLPVPLRSLQPYHNILMIVWVKLTGCCTCCSRCDQDSKVEPEDQTEVKQNPKV